MVKPPKKGGIIISVQSNPIKTPIPGIWGITPNRGKGRKKKNFGEQEIWKPRGPRGVMNICPIPPP